MVAKTFKVEHSRGSAVVESTCIWGSNHGYGAHELAVIIYADEIEIIPKWVDWIILLFIPTWGEYPSIQFDKHICSNGWLNHQLLSRIPIRSMDGKYIYLLIYYQKNISQIS